MKPLLATGADAANAGLGLFALICLHSTQPMCISW